MTINKVVFFLIIILSLFGIYCSITIGLSWDEFYHHINGSHRVEYLKTFGKFINYNYLDNRYYPGLYDALHFAILNFLLNLSPTSIIELKHLIHLSFGFSTLLGLFLISTNIFNKEIGSIAVLLCLLNPFYFGHMSINPKDTIICFALVWFAYSAYLYCTNIEKRHLGYILLISFFMGFGLGTRISFFAITIPIILSVFIFFFVNRKKYQKYLTINKIVTHVLIILIISFLLMIIAWPHIHHSLLLLPKVILNIIANSINWSMGPTLEIMNGNIYEAQNTPRTYLLNFFIFRKPIYILILLLSLIFFLINDNNFFTARFDSFNNKIIIIFAIILFPIILAIVLQTKLYNGIRLFLFIIPWLSLLTAVSFYYILKNFKKYFFIKIISVFFVVSFMLFFQRFIFLTPYHYDYSNFFHTKFINTQKLYIHDYWASSYKELFKLISLRTDLEEIKIHFCGGDRPTVKYLANKFSSNNVKFVPSKSADYVVMINTTSTNVNEKLTCFSLYPGKDIVAVKRLGVKFSVLRKLEK